jgi:outer membrane protein assembly factor BamA
VEFFGEWLGGDYDAVKHEVDFRQYVLLKGPDKSDIDFSINPDTNLKNHVFAVRLFGGYTTGDISLSDNFYLGGSSTIRGPERDARFGDKAWLTNVEYRFPIMGNLGGVLFTDAGNAFTDDDDLDENEWLWSAGAGIRFKIPALGLGPLRLDYGYSIQGSDRNQVVFGFGHMF